MEDYNNKPLNEEELPEDEDYELSHTDKLVGVFTEPVSMFTKSAQFPARAIDWLIPVILVIVAAILSNFLLMSNPQIKYSVIEKQMSMVEKGLNQAVESGQMSEQQADQQKEAIRTQIEKNIDSGILVQAVGIVIVFFIIFFIIAGVFFLIAKFGLKGEGTYSNAMVAWGLPYYISVIQIIATVIISLSMDQLIRSTSVATLLGSDTETFVGFLLDKIDILSIWFFAVVSIGYAKMFKAKSATPYFIMVFGMWLGFTTLLFFLAQQIPFLKFFMQ